MSMTELHLFNGVFKGKKVLVTGDTGFKGSWLSLWLKELGAEVYGYALPAETKDSNFSRMQLEKYINHEDGDVRDLKSFEARFNEVNPDAAFHLAAQPIVLKSYQDPQLTYETNLMGTVNFLECVRKTPNLKAAVIITSDKCYFNDSDAKSGYKENDRLGGSDPYSASKACAELITDSYVSSYFKTPESLNIATARAGNVIGGGDWSENRLIPDFFRSVVRKEKVHMRYPNAVRPWQYVLEPLSGYLSLCSFLLSGDKKFQGAWNFGPDRNYEICVSDLINRIINAYGEGEIEILEETSHYHETNILKLDISKAREFLGWLPVLNIDDTIEFTVKGYKDEFVNGSLYGKRLAQLEEYILRAKHHLLNWTIS